MAVLKNTTIDDTGSVYLPVGTSADRPSNPQDGDFRYNTDLGYAEFFFKGFWVNAETNKGSVPMQGLICLLDVNNPNSFTPGDSTIFDISGGTSYNGTIIGTPTVESTETGALYLAGNTSEGIDIGINVDSVTGREYTVMTVAGYNGGNRERITTSTGNNWLLGHWSSGTVRYYPEGWVTQETTSGTGSTLDQWGVHVGTGNGQTDQWQYFKNGGYRTITLSGGSQGPTNLTINIGPENSDWKWQLIAVWDRELGQEDIVQLTSSIRARGGF